MKRSFRDSASGSRSFASSFPAITWEMGVNWTVLPKGKLIRGDNRRALKKKRVFRRK